MPVYTLVHYRPNYNPKWREKDYGSDSAIDIESFIDKTQVVESIAQKLYDDAFSANVYAYWETTLLIDGYQDCGDPDATDAQCEDSAAQHRELYAMAHDRSEVLIAEHKEKERLKKEQELIEAQAKRAAHKAKTEESTVKAEIAKYKELHAKYGPSKLCE